MQATSEPKPFWGWLELMQVLQNMIDLADRDAETRDRRAGPASRLTDGR